MFSKEINFLMKKSLILLNYFFISMIVLFGCSESLNSSGEYLEIKKNAWDYLVENDWESSASKKLEEAIVEEVILKEREANLLNDSFIGKEILKVTFQEKENQVLSPPQILINPENNKVIGYISSE